ncbi:MAG TPA: hypothetical protein VHI50_05685 [Micromonosporaceae bacterium]|nr:hypothetical protein [Micromonosporaceae bacterium]
MGTLSGGNGGGSSPDGGGDRFDGLPDLPPEWGVVVPDDPAELAEEAAEVRRELRLEASRGSWQRLLGLSGAAGDESASPSARLPIVIIMIAVLAALISMFALGWQREAAAPRRSGAPQRTAATTAVVPELKTLPALDLVDSRGGTTSLRGLAPAVILLIDGCDCRELIETTAGATPRGVNVVTVARTSSPSAAGVTGVRSLGDPTGGLRQALGPAAETGPVALLVDRSGDVRRTVPRVRNVDAYRADLSGLAA